MTSHRSATTSTDLFTDAAALVRERLLVRGTSLCRARDRVWRRPHLDDLLERLRVAAEAGQGDLRSRWEGALDGAGDEVVQLAGEALAVHLLIAGDVRAATKRAQIAATLARSSRPTTLPKALDGALAHGRTPTGVAFKRRRLSQVAFLLAAVRSWRDLGAADRRAGLADPWVFRDWLATVPLDGAHAQREALLHLVHPADFEPITSRMAKRRIVTELASDDELALDTDRALRAIRARLTASYGTGFSFGDAPLVDRWLR